jgi:hypothetical protein
MSKQEGPMDWEGLIRRLLHSTQLQIIEAMLWIGRPLSATELSGVFGPTISLSSVSYHLKRLTKLGVLRRVRKRQVRGAWESFYYFVSR